MPLMKTPTDTPLADRRFEAPDWQQWPYSFMAQSFLAQQQAWHEATLPCAAIAPTLAAVMSEVTADALKQN